MFDVGPKRHDSGDRAGPEHEREADRASTVAPSGGWVGGLSAVAAATLQRAGAELIVADDADVGPGQMRRSDFLAELRRDVCAASDDALSPTGRTSDGCPEIDHWFGLYGDRDAASIERAVRRYAPETANAASAREYVAPVVARVRSAVERWVSTGEVTGVPDVATLAVEGLGGAVTDAVAEVGAVVSNMVSAPVDVLSVATRILFTPREGGPRATPEDPGSIRSELGRGEPLDARTRARMESAFRRSFDTVRVHHDAGAAAVADRLSARAFAVGSDVAFAPGEYRPGSLAGDALIAHELAHTVQQAGGTGTADAAALEHDADAAAAGAFGLGAAHAPLLRGGLQLTRCSRDRSTPTPAPTPAPVVPRTETTAFGTYRIVADSTPAPLAADQLTQAQFVRLQTAWTKVNDNTGGLTITGSAADKTELITMIGREMGRSKTFRDLIVEITEDTARPVTVKVGRNNAYWVDEFSSNVLDLDDLAWFEDVPPAAYPWVQTSGEILLHVLAERRHGVVHGTGYDPAHESALAAGGPQETYRTERGQTGRFISQTGAEVSPGLRVGTYTDTAGNKVLIRRDNSAGAPIVYEMEYVPATVTAAAPGLTRRNEMTARVTAAGGAGAATARIAVRFSGATRNDTAPAAVLGGGQTYRVPLGQIVPTGGPITVEVLEQPATGAPNVLLTTTWSHPFAATTANVTVGGVRYDLALSMQRTP